MSSTKKVLFICHGGTIGQVLTEVAGKMVLASPRDGEQFRMVCAPIIDSFCEKTGMTVDFEVMTTKDSTNLGPEDWERLIFRIRKAQDEEGYCAVGITHGTDTMVYTMTAVALGLHGVGQSGLQIPVVFTGAQNSIYEEGGDGEFNLRNLFRVIHAAVEMGIADVLLSFWKRVLLGCRAMKVSEKDFDAFHSPVLPDVGRINALGVTLYPGYLRKKVDHADRLKVAPKFAGGTICIELSPGLEPGTILGMVENGGVKVVILKSLGEGNVCSEGRYNLIPTIETATKTYCTPVLLCTKFAGGNVGTAHYETGHMAIMAGGVPCGDTTDVAVEVKARWLLANGVCTSAEGFQKAMATSYAGEVTA